MIISPFNSIFLLHSGKRCGIESSYTQVFSPEDTILYQIIRTADEQAVDVNLINASTGTLVETLTPETTSINTGSVDCFTISDLSDGFYYLEVGNFETETFRIVSDSDVLANTVLIEYSPVDNRVRRDVVGMLEDLPLYFSFRIPGGFKDDGWAFAVDTESFVTEMSDIVELYSRESTQLTLTMGHSAGVPIWFGDLLNRLLTCRYVYIDGLRYTRFQSSVPEKEQTIEGTNSFVFTQKLQRVNYLNPKKA